MQNYYLQKATPEIRELLQELKAELQQATRPADEVILDDVDLRKLLKVSPRTTATWRQKRLIRHSFIQGKCYYRYSDILEAIERNAIPTIHQNLKVKL
jgi:hypothetical protein